MTEDENRRVLWVFALTWISSLGRVRRLALYVSISGRDYAGVAELVDALASGVSGGNPVEVQVLSSVPDLLSLPEIRPGSQDTAVELRIPSLPLSVTWVCLCVAVLLSSFLACTRIKHNAINHK